MATFRYFIIGGDGKTYPQQIYVNEGRFNNFNDFQAEAQRLINTELQDSGAVQLTLPDLSTGQETLVPEAQKNYNRSNGTTNLGGRTINLTNPAGASIYQGGSSPLLPAGSNIPTLPGMLNASSPETNPSTFYGDVNTGYGAATPGMANSAGQTEATLNTQRQAEIDRQLGVGGFSQGSIPFYGAGDGPQNVLRDSARGSGIPITREESSATSGGPLDTDFMAESAGAMAGFGESASELEKRRETEQEQERQAEIDLEKQNEFYDTGNYRSEGYPGEARLLKEIEKNGTIYRQYEFNLTGERGKTAYSGYFIVAPGKDNIYNDAFRFEYPITDEAFEKGVDWGGININDFAFTNEQDNSNIILSGIFTNFKNKATSERENSLSSIFKDLGRDYQIDASKLDTGNFGSFLGKEEIQFEAGDEIEQKAEGIDETLKGSGFVSEVGGDGPKTIVATDGSIVNTDNITSVKSAPTYSGASLENFFKEIGFNVPKENGSDINIDRFTSFPGFPSELLDPANLFIEVEEITTIPDPTDPSGLKTVEQRSTRFVANPAIEAAIQIYAENLRTRTDLQKSSDDTLQAQINATGGKAGPADGLNPVDLANLERELQTISSTGGRLASVSRGEGDSAELVQELTQLGQQELTQEAVRASGGLLGGFYSPLDAQGNPLESGGQRFVQGFNPQELLQSQQQQELDRIQAQNIPSILQAQLEAQQLGQQQSQNEAQRRAGILGQLSDIYSNPAQLAAIVRSGGNPLTQLQNELNRALPTGSTSSPFNIPQNLTNMPTASTSLSTSGIPTTMPATTTNAPQEINNRAETDAAVAEAQNFAQVNDPTTNQTIKISASSAPGNTPQRVDENGMVVAIEGAFYTIENVATGLVEERFIPNTEIRNYGLQDPFVFGQIANSINYQGPAKEFFGLTDENVNTALVEAGRLPAPTITDAATSPRFDTPDIPIYNPQMTEADIPLSNYGQQTLFGSAAVEGLAPDEVARRAAGFTPGGSSPLQGYFGGNPLGERAGVL